MSRNPFLQNTDQPLVAMPGRRNGYLMLAAARETLRYEAIPDAIFLAAKAWAAALEAAGAPRVYWFILSEVTPHYHIHVFPRWPEDTEQGVPLFEGRNRDPQPAWTDAMLGLRARWAEAHRVFVAEGT